MRNVRGVTIIEVLVALIVLETGVLALLTSYAGVTRLIGRGKLATRSAAIAATRLELLREEEERAVPPCTGVLAGSISHPGGLVESWRVTAAARSVELFVIVSYPAVPHPVSDTFTTTMTC